MTFEYYYNLFHKVKRMVDQRGTEYTYLYDNKGNLEMMLEATGRATGYLYDDNNGFVKEVISYGDGDTASTTTKYTYDAAGNVESITDPLGNIVHFTKHDAMGHVLEMEDARGQTWKYAYDARGRQTSQTDPLGRVTSTNYNAANNVTNVTAFGLETKYLYDDWDRLEKVISPSKHYTSTTYNLRGLPVEVKEGTETDPEKLLTKYEYDDRGRLLHATDSANNKTSYFSDDTRSTRQSSDVPVEIIYPTYTHYLLYDRMQRATDECVEAEGEADRCTSVVYDQGGNIKTSTDAEGKTTTFEYDALNRLIRQEAPDGGVTEYKYDARNNLIRLKNPNGGITEFEYDVLNRLTKVIRPMLQEIQYVYAPNGAWKQATLPAGQRVKTSYDVIGRIDKIEYYAADGTLERVVEFTYKQNKDLVDVVTEYQGIAVKMRITYTYNNFDRPTGEIVSITDGPELSYTYTYKADGRLESFSASGGVSQTYEYDEYKRLQHIQIPGQPEKIISFSNFDWNSPQRMQFPGNNVTQFGYNGFRELTSLVAKDTAQNSILDRSYTYYLSGNLETKTIKQEQEEGVYDYQYDNAYRLILADFMPSDSVLSTIADETYTYDLLGNRRTQYGINEEWKYNKNSELLGYADVKYVYDANGNLTQIKVADAVVWTYVYDVANRLVHVEDGTGSIKADYGYDPFGRRLWKKVDGITTYFLYSDEGLIGEYDADGTEIRTYGYSGGQPLYLKKNGVYYWSRNDRLGAPQKLVSTNGAIVWSARYTAFGEAVVDVESVENPLRFPGQYHDKETGLYYNLNRYYDPKIGRYLQTDPAGDGLNPYLYAAANPVNAIDPDGLCALRMYGGGAEIYFGAGLLGAGPAGWFVGALMILNGADNLIAGGRSAVTGEYKQAFLESGIHHYVQNDLAANLLYMGTQIGLGYAGIRVHRAAIRAVQVAGDLTEEAEKWVASRPSPKYDFKGGGRYKHPQAWIDEVIETDPRLSNVKLTYRPKYSGRLKTAGRAWYRPKRVLIGRSALVSRDELVKTILHEELHHRIWARAARGVARDMYFTRINLWGHQYIEDVIARFLKMKGVP